MRRPVLYRVQNGKAWVSPANNYVWSPLYCLHWAFMGRRLDLIILNRHITLILIFRSLKTGSLVLRYIHFTFVLLPGSHSIVKFGKRSRKMWHDNLMKDSSGLRLFVWSVMTDSQRNGPKVGQHIYYMKLLATSLASCLFFRSHSSLKCAA